MILVNFLFNHPTVTDLSQSDHSTVTDFAKLRG